MKLRTEAIICSIWSMSRPIAARKDGGARSSLKRIRARGVRKSWEIARTMPVRSST